VTDKVFISFAAQESRESGVTDAVKLMKPLSELKLGGLAAEIALSLLLGIDITGY
jgi:hypothetical protein